MYNHHAVVSFRHMQSETGRLVPLAGPAPARLAIGDRLGLFKDLAENGPADPEAFAMRTGIDARYAREWLEAMAAAAYVEFDPESSNFTLPPEHARPLADDTCPLFHGALWSMLTYSMAPFDELVEAFRNGGGVPQSSFRT